jgi:hypothetical protein
MKNNVEITPSTAAALTEMRDELECNRLEVFLVPQRIRTNEGGMIRAAYSKNASWYRFFCACYSSSRRRRNALFDTRIKRRDTLRVLNGLINNGRSKSKYAEDVLEIARGRVRDNPGVYAAADAGGVWEDDADEATHDYTFAYACDEDGEYPF